MRKYIYLLVVLRILAVNSIYSVYRPWLIARVVFGCLLPSASITDGDGSQAGFVDMLAAQNLDLFCSPA